MKELRYKLPEFFGAKRLGLEFACKMDMENTYRMQTNPPVEPGNPGPTFPEPTPEPDPYPVTDPITDPNPNPEPFPTPPEPIPEYPPDVTY